MVQPAILAAIMNAYSKLDGEEFDSITDIASELGAKLHIDVLDALDLVGQLGMTLVAKGPVRSSVLFENSIIIDDVSQI